MNPPQSLGLGPWAGVLSRCAGLKDRPKGLRLETQGSPESRAVPGLRVSGHWARPMLRLMRPVHGPSESRPEPEPRPPLSAKGRSPAVLAFRLLAAVRADCEAAAFLALLLNAAPLACVVPFLAPPAARALAWRACTRACHLQGLLLRGCMYACVCFRGPLPVRELDPRPTPLPPYNSVYVTGAGPPI